MAVNIQLECEYYWAVSHNYIVLWRRFITNRICCATNMHLFYIFWENIFESDLPRRQSVYFQNKQVEKKEMPENVVKYIMYSTLTCMWNRICHMLDKSFQQRQKFLPDDVLTIFFFIYTTKNLGHKTTWKHYFTDGEHWFKVEYIFIGLIEIFL